MFGRRGVISWSRAQFPAPGVSDGTVCRERSRHLEDQESAQRCQRRRGLIHTVEGFAITPTDIDFKNQSLRVERAATDNGRVKDTKNHDTRTVDLTPTLPRRSSTIGCRQ